MKAASNEGAPPRYPYTMAAEVEYEYDCTPAGLCADCACGRRIESPRGSTFYLCERSSTDPSFPKYPRLPALACPGYSSTQ
jgi:hypothetical protein